MREIKFRAWDKINRNMLVNTNLMYPALSLNGVLIAYNGDEKIPDTVSENRFVLMQYTGLKDKNGVEIYEGDILYVFNRRNWVVEFFFGGFKMRDLKKTRFEYLSIDTYSNEVEADGTVSSVEIIGNIYENPDFIRDNE